MKYHDKCTFVSFVVVVLIDAARKGAPMTFDIVNLKPKSPKKKV